MWPKDLQLEAFPQETLTASEKGASSTAVSVGAEG